MTTQEMTGGDTLQDQTQESGGTTLSSSVTKSEFKEGCFDLRGTIEVLKLNVKLLKNHKFAEKESSSGDIGEVQANLQLAYRHLEDARMRIGKAVQAYDGGGSCYPR